jgi:hypothetical protein
VDERPDDEIEASADEKADDEDTPQLSQTQRKGRAKNPPLDPSDMKQDLSNLPDGTYQLRLSTYELNRIALVLRNGCILAAYTYER